MNLVLVQSQFRLAPDADNIGVLRAALRSAAHSFACNDILLLPECFHRNPSHAQYQHDLSALARALGCHVIGGSHHEPTPAGALNTGSVFDPDGHVIGRYDKLRPYATERERVQAGSSLGEVVIAGRHVLVLLCSDFWFVDLLQRAARLPDLILVPALSVSRKPDPQYSRTLWRHLAVARAYEFGAYVGISDWAHSPEPLTLSASGVGGFADPTTTTPDALFSSIGDRSVAVHRLDFAALDEFRRDRTSRGFFWRAPAAAAPPAHEPVSDMNDGGASL